MFSRYVTAALVATMLTSAGAFAQTTTPPPTDKQSAPAKAVIEASPTLAKTPGAADAASRKTVTAPTGTAGTPEQAAADTTLTPQVTQAFKGTAASIHSEDQCTILNLNVSRFIQPDNNSTTFLNYSVQRFCTGGAAGTGSASGSLEIPDVAFSGDPRTDNDVKLKIDTLPAELIQGPPLIVDLTWTKDDSSVSQGANRQSTKTKTEDGTFVVVAFRSVFNSNSATLTGTIKTDTDIPLTAAEASISWDDYRDVRRTE